MMVEKASRGRRFEMKICAVDGKSHSPGAIISLWSLPSKAAGCPLSLCRLVHINLVHVTSSFSITVSIISSSHLHIVKPQQVGAYRMCVRSTHSGLAVVCITWRYMKAKRTRIRAAKKKQRVSRWSAPRRFSSLSLLLHTELSPFLASTNIP